MRPEVLKAALRGWTNRDEELGRKKRLRQPITILHLQMMKILLKMNEPGWSLYKRRLVFTVAVICFWGALRMGEALCKSARKYDSDNDLLLQDVKLKKTMVNGKDVEYLTVRLKSTKVCRKLEKGLSVEIYRVDGPLCPVTAWKRYRALTREDDGELPAFRTEEGLSYSHTNMNKDLKTVFDKRIEYGAVSGHSFRIGLASLLAECGYDDGGEIKKTMANSRQKITLPFPFLR